MHSTSELHAEKLPCKVNPTLVAGEDHGAGTEIKASWHSGPRRLLGDSTEKQKPN